MLSVKNLAVSLSGREIILPETMSFEIGRGEIAALLGPNGSGKSTLLGALCGLVKKQGGGILYDSIDVESLTARERAKIFAHVPQSERPTSDYTVLESVVMGRYPHLKSFDGYNRDDYEIARESLRRVDLAGFEERIVTKLSGGEAARTVIARALAQDSPVLLLDEPAAALDPKHARIIMDLTKELAGEGRTILMAMHDINLAISSSDRLIFIVGGSIADDMPSLRVTEDVLERVYGISWEIWSTGGDASKLVAIPGAVAQAEDHSP
ncbi:MAG: ABC transporter ATP-binding protein [Synergistaceae bacterium]|jgi:iron complex transport system ATP-binding protein|nr:ABC transporter ATP-binding protein [Synergistaceae bacterium]